MLFVSVDREFNWAGHFFLIFRHLHLQMSKFKTCCTVRVANYVWSFRMRPKSPRKKHWGHSKRVKLKIWLILTCSVTSVVFLEDMTSLLNCAQREISIGRWFSNRPFESAMFYIREHPRTLQFNLSLNNSKPTKQLIFKRLYRMIYFDNKC